MSWNINSAEIWGSLLTTSVHNFSLSQNIVGHSKLAYNKYVCVLNYVNRNKNLVCVRARMILVYVFLPGVGLQP